MVATVTDSGHGREILAGDELVPVLVRVFNDQEKEALQVAQAGGIARLGDWTSALARASRDVFVTWVKWAAEWSDAHRQKTIAIGDITAMAEQLSFDMVKGVNETTQARLRRQFVEGLAAGDSPAGMAARVEDVFVEARGPRAESIALTESSRAMHKAQILAAERSGVVIGKQWLLSAGACAICVAIAADSESRLVALRESFAQVGDVAVEHPPAHPR